MKGVVQTKPTTATAAADVYGAYLELSALRGLRFLDVSIAVATAIVKSRINLQHYITRHLVLTRLGVWTIRKQVCSSIYLALDLAIRRQAGGPALLQVASERIHEPKFGY
jgi:hypothetical protein